MRPKLVPSKQHLDQLASLYERQGYEILKLPNRLEAYDRKTGKLIKVAVTR